MRIHVEPDANSDVCHILRTGLREKFLKEWKCDVSGRVRAHARCARIDVREPARERQNGCMKSETILRACEHGWANVRWISAYHESEGLWAGVSDANVRVQTVVTWHTHHPSGPTQALIVRECAWEHRTRKCTREVVTWHTRRPSEATGRCCVDDREWTKSRYWWGERMGGGWMKGGGWLLGSFAPTCGAPRPRAAFFKVITGLTEAESNYRRERGPV